MTDRLDAEPPIAPLAAGEARLLQTVDRPDGNRNDIYLIHRRPSDAATMGTGEPIDFVAIIRSTDQDPNDASPPFAWQRGPTERSIYIAVAEAFARSGTLPGTSVSLHPDVQWFVDQIDKQSGPTVSRTETTANWAQLYASACGEVLAAGNACIEVANQAVGARNVAAQRPQAEISIQHFTKYAEDAERRFGPPYAAFAQACTTARNAAVQLSADNDLFAEMILTTTVDQQTLDNVATAKAILTATFGPTPETFLAGLDEANALMQTPPEEGNIYRPAAPVPSGERICPWCAETIKAAAVICRFCGRDVQGQTNAG